MAGGAAAGSEMEAQLAILVFFLVGGASIWLGLQACSPRYRALRRLVANGESSKARVIPPIAVLWREVVARVGSMAPIPAKELPRLKGRLIRAGFRRPEASRYFHGIRAICT